MNTCITCGTKLSWYEKKYCSNRCQSTQSYFQYIQKWKAGESTGNRGIRTRNVSSHIKRYLVEKYGEKCSLCGWDKINPVSQVVPLEIDHIDGNAENTIEVNLRLICPNCHALSSNFRNLNKGYGRSWRRKNTKGLGID